MIASVLTNESEGRVSRYPSQDVNVTEAIAAATNIYLVYSSLLLFIVKRIPDYNPISIPNVTDFKLGNAQVATPLTGCSGSIFL